jgi:hypothetical protein
MLRTFVSGSAVVALLILPASAQIASPDSSSSLGIPLKSDRPISGEEVERRKATDRAYEATMHKIPDKKAPADPWGDIRQGTSANTKNKQP